MSAHFHLLAVNISIFYITFVFVDFCVLAGCGSCRADPDFRLLSGIQGKNSDKSQFTSACGTYNNGDNIWWACKSVCLYLCFSFETFICVNRCEWSRWTVWRSVDESIARMLCRQSSNYNYNYNYEDSHNDNHNDCTDDESHHIYIAINNSCDNN